MSDLPQAKKTLGQHWLQDNAILQKIVDEAGVQPGDRVLEIGPGPGTLTQTLLDAGASVTAVEYDEALAEELQKTFQDVTVHQQDILTFDFSQLEPPYKVVANIPYYLTSKLIRILSELKTSPDVVVLLVQKEVAERVCAAPGAMSLLSVSAQFYSEASLGIEVPATFFTPPPKVDSQTVILRPRVQPLFANVDDKKFFRIVKAGFSNRRKTLLNSLSAGLHMSKVETTALLVKAGISTMARPQELSLEQWYELYKLVD